MVALCRPAHAFNEQETKSKALTAYTMGVIYDLYGMTEEAVTEFEKAADYSKSAAVYLFRGLG